MKIVHIVTSLDFGGLERRIEILAKYPPATNKLFFCALGDGGATYKKVVSLGSNVTLLGKDIKIPRFKTLYAILKYLREVRPDVVHTHGCEANFYGIIAAKILRVRLVVAEEIGIPLLSSKSKFIFSQVYKFCDALICMSPAVQDYMASNKLVADKKLVRVYNPVLLSAIRKSKESAVGKPIKFIFIGRLEEVKNPLGLAQAFKLLLDEGYHATLTFVGDGNQKELLEYFISQHSLQKYIQLLGFCSDPIAIACEHDVVVQPSHTEGFSLALVEAMSCALPALATPAGSAVDLIQNGVNGWIALSSEVQDIYDGLSLVCDNRASLFDMGQVAAERVDKKHDPALYAQKLDLFYSELLN